MPCEGMETVAGLTVIETDPWLLPVTVTTDEADFVGSATLVAVTVATVFTVTLGAWYRPLLETVPCVAVHVTPRFEVPVTVAVSCTVPCDATVASAGLTVTATAPFEAMTRL